VSSPDQPPHAEQPSEPPVPVRPGDDPQTSEPSRYVWPSEFELAAPERYPDGRRQSAMALGVAVAIGALGFAVGLLWLAISPRVPIVKVEGGYQYAVPEPEQAVASDGWFLFLGVGLGILLALACWFLLRRYRGVGMLVALTVGSLLGAWAAWWLGHHLAIADFNHVAAAAPVGAHLQAPVELAITNMDPRRWWFPGLTGVVVAQALAAAVVYTALAGFSGFENLRGPSPVRVLPAIEPQEPSSPPA
jgi:hypothetical protein